MKRRSFFATITALLAMFWPRAKSLKQTKPSPAEVFGAAYEAGIEFQVSFATRDGEIRISKTSPPKVLPSQWVAFTRHKLISLSGSSYEEALNEIADWLVNSMTPEEKKRYYRYLAKGARYGPARLNTSNP